MPRETSLLAMVLQVEPDHYALKRNVVEYEFTALTAGPPETHENSMRVFRGLYDERGPYAEQDAPDGGLNWNGQQMTWNGVDISWSDN